MQLSKEINNFIIYQLQIYATNFCINNSTIRSFQTFIIES